MNKYTVTRRKSIADGLNFLWIEETYEAEYYKVEGNGRLHLYDERDRDIATFAKNHWALIEEVGERV